MDENGSDDTWEHPDEAGPAPDESTPPRGRLAAGSTGGLVAGILIGAILGAGIALLVAPEKGAKTRRRVGRELRSVRDETVDRLDQATLRARRDLARRRRRLRKRLQRGASDARERLFDLE